MDMQPVFPQSERQPLREALEQGGWVAAVAYAAHWADPAQRLKLLSLATRIASGPLRTQFSLDQLVEMNSAAIDGALAAMAEHSAEPELADGFKQQANVMAYNFAADLAPCWPGDDEPRARRHYEKGVELGRRMVRWRIELNKKAENFALAYWALGIHLLGLGEAGEAAEAFGKALEHSRVAAEEYGRKPVVAADGDWQVILNSGYQGLARAVGGDLSGRGQYAAAVAALGAMAEEQPELAEDARFGMAQLAQTDRLFLPSAGQTSPDAV
jgi:hypothetical protein